MNLEASQFGFVPERLLRETTAGAHEIADGHPWLERVVTLGPHLARYPHDSRRLRTYRLQLQLIDKGCEVLAATVLEVEQIPVQASVLFYPLKIGPIRLYALGGGGAYITRSSGVNSFISYGKVTKTNFGAHLGGGTDILLGGSFYLSGDVRYIWLNIDSFDDVEQAYKEKRNADYWVATAMINFRF